MSIEVPYGPVPLNSQLYIERYPFEKQICTEIETPGSFIRIKAPQKMGKSSLIIRAIAHARSQGYHALTIDFQEADQSIYSSLDKFLRWFCAKIAIGLQLPPNLDDYWDAEIGSKASSSTYLQEYILAEIEPPILLTLNEVNLVFEYANIAQEFLPLLRFWYEQSRQLNSFEKIRWIVACSTEIYVKLNLHQSPFNIGLPIQLSPFNLSQIQELSARHGLSFTEKSESLLWLMKMTGGHPYLIRIALYHLHYDPSILEKMQQDPLVCEKIYSKYLQKKWDVLQENPQLLIAFKQLVTQPDRGMPLEPIIAYKLESMGLVNIKGDRAQISCELYRHIFANPYLVSSREQDCRIEELEKENQKLKVLANTDSLTQIANRRYFDSYLSNEWQKCIKEIRFISLILLDIDYFKQYNDTYGHQEGDRCLQKVASAIRKCLHHTEHLIARYGGEEFAVILTGNNPIRSLNIAEDIMQKIGDLNIANINSQLDLKQLTISIGIASTIPQPDDNLSLFFDKADRALYQSKEGGRNKVTLSQ